ncbi:succinate dehydrogenase [Aestuariicoccus sp. MJ-SS9]|uniref:succinate dehydrogenase n=1 Tax=Aestuariicoccus sp. MJ-SS9 TaxID=3079855 RepID=UPI00290C5D06|nr:succinate dehydrogenase [Aestuariicoccus sp. MJ-SS9]MDU8913155.1 succinate dehydrogenase [Aestuariicoccus sp. MJ-SS9]
MLDLRLYMLQRITALMMAPFVLVHLGVMIYAIQGGLSAAEILGRTQGSVGWLLFYGTFVLAAGVHGAIGLRVILHEWAGLAGVRLNALSWGIGALLILMGGRAVFAVTFGAGT